MVAEQVKPARALLICPLHFDRARRQLSPMEVDTHWLT